MSVKKRFSTKHNRDVWGYDARIGGRRREKFGFSTRAAAELALANARVRENERRAGVRVDAPPVAGVTIKELVERRKKTLGRATAKRVLGDWLAGLPAHLRVADLKTAHLSDYVERRLEHVKPQTVFRELSDICSTLNSARDYFPSLEDWQPPRRPDISASSRSRDRVITQAEARSLLAHLRRERGDAERVWYYELRLDAADLLQIALLTAARRSEILSLQWTDVNFEWKTLRVVGTKTDKVRTIPTTQALVELLLRRKQWAGRDARVFPRARNSMLAEFVNQCYRESSKDLGIPYGRETPGGWVLHDARHTAITAMLHAGSSLESVMAISGHSARVMTMRYAHSNEQTRRAAVSALDQFAA